MKVIKTALALVLMLSLMTACGDDDPAGPEEFQVRITARDPLGNPVEGLELTMAPDGPWYMDGKALDVDPVPIQSSLSAPSPNPFNPVTTLRYQAAQACWVSLVIKDVDLDAVRTILAQEIPAGAHAVVWNSLDDEDRFMPSGVYFAHLVLSEEEDGEVLFDGFQTLLLARWGEGSQPVAVTDAAGRIVLTERRLFPYLYDLEPFPSFNEVGEQTGVIVLTPTMRFYLTDPTGPHTMRFDDDVTGRAAFTFTWEY